MSLSIQKTRGVVGKSPRGEKGLRADNDGIGEEKL